MSEDEHGWPNGPGWSGRFSKKTASSTVTLRGLRCYYGATTDHYRQPRQHPGGNYRPTRIPPMFLTCSNRPVPAPDHRRPPGTVPVSLRTYWGLTTDRHGPIRSASVVPVWLGLQTCHTDSETGFNISGQMLDIWHKSISCTLINQDWCDKLLQLYFVMHI